MKNQLINLKESMNNTVLKNGIVTNSEKQRILEAAIINKKNEKNKRYFLAPILSFVFVTSCLVIMGVYIYNKAFFSMQHLNSPKNSEARIDSASMDHSINSKKSEKNTNEEVRNYPDQQNSINPPNYPYIILNGYYYKKTGEVVNTDQLGEVVGEVKRIGDWAIKQSGDSNEIPGGPIFAIKGKSKDEFIVGKGVVYENGQNKAGYLVFQRMEKIQEADTSKILNAKGDSKEVHIAFRNIKNKIGLLYGFIEPDSIASLSLISYGDGTIIRQIYEVPQGNKQSDQGEIPGELFISQYNKGIIFSDSRFIRPTNKVLPFDKKEFDMEQKKIDNWITPNLIESFNSNGISWGIYKDTFYNDLVLKGETGDYYFEITYQGEFTLKLLKNLVGNFKKS